MVTSTINFHQEIFITLEDLEELIKEALKKTGLEKEVDLCSYLFHEGKRLSPTTYLTLKDTDRKTLYQLIKENLIEPNSPEFFAKRAKNSEKLSYTGQSLEECIRAAMVKLNIQRETAMCKYIPYEKGHLHHFTYLKLKSANPIQLRNLIKMHILDQRPQLLPPMKRKQYGFQDARQPVEDRFFEAEEDLKEVIRQAMQRRDLNLEKEEDLCRYLPKGDSFLDPLGFRSLKRNNPRELIRLIRNYVITPVSPELLEWKKIDRCSSNFEPFRGSQQQKSPLRNDDRVNQLLESVERLVQVIQKTSSVEQRISDMPIRRSNKFLGARFKEKFFQDLQMELITKILKREIDVDLWETYVELLNNEIL